MIKDRPAPSPTGWHPGLTEAVLAITCVLAIVWSATRTSADHFAGVPAIVIALTAAFFAFRSERIATRVERSASGSGNRLSRQSEAEFEIQMPALQVFGDSERAVQWMRESNPALGGQTPILAVGTDSGIKAVRDILGRIEHGVIS
jgi:putative toxin-antitoxin system antitoxin component (TIGR02293 family)